MDWLRALLETSPLTALFLTIAVGYLVGEINLKGFALGSGAVLFVGLACGAFAPKSAPPGLLGTLGLLLFLYCVGIQYGNEWYRGLTSPEGLKANVAGALRPGRRGCRLARDLPDAARRACRRRSACSPAPARARRRCRRSSTRFSSQDAAVGYSVTYPFGVAGPILCMYRLPRDLQAGDRGTRRSADPAGRSPRAQRGAGRPSRSRSSSSTLPERRPGRRDPRAASRTACRRRPRCSSADDVLLIVGTDPAAIDEGPRADRRRRRRRARGGPDRPRLRPRLRVAGAASSGMPLGSLKIPGGFDYSYIQVRRGDTDLLPDDDLVLEFGDRVGVLCSRAHFPAVRSFYGDSIKGAADFSYISHRRRRGDGPARRDDSASDSRRRPDHARAGRCAAGRARARQASAARPGSCGRCPLSANLVLRNFGLTVFLAQVGHGVRARSSPRRSPRPGSRSSCSAP